MTSTALDHLEPLDVREPEPRPARDPRRLLHGRADDPAWVRPALLALLAATGVLYFWGLSASGWANSFYAAAVQAGSVSWKAFFFGSSDAAGSITVDKSPASLWLMELSARTFGLSSWSMLAPQAVLGIATVGTVYAAVRRVASAGAGLLAGAVCALTPVAVLMFRFNNPDALLVLCMALAAYWMTRATEDARTTWLLLAGSAIGVGFLAKMLQVLLVVPGFALVYLVLAPTGFWRRVRQLLLAGVALVASAGWWVAIVELWPASDRPYIGGSQHNSILELVIGYNGLGRLDGDETGSVVGGGGGAGGNGGGMWGSTGLTRLFGSEIGGQVSWLIPAALVALVAGLALTWRAQRTDRVRAALLIWGSWLAGTALVFSEMKGIFHPYYTVALAPAIGATLAIGAELLWRGRSSIVVSWVMAATVAGTGWLSFDLLSRSASFVPWLRWAVLGAGLLAAVLMLGATLRARVAVAAVVLSLVAGLGGPAAYAVQTASTGHTGSIPSAGPQVAGGRGPGPGGGGGFRGGPRGGFPGGTAPGGTAPTGTTGGFRGGAGGGLLEGSTPSTAITQALLADAGDYTWVAAAVGSNSASGYQLATGKPVMAIGGFNGSDPSPTLAQFEAYVAAGKIHYFIAGGGMGGGTQMGGSGASSSITSWVESHCTATTIGGVTVYDLTAPTD
ncbi:4-amino-4-deoxy-L-arabinose transferase-like glycosyltransferase [Motilibacter rhizosphaerae]|uniref:4-amino-4-deoxy-L-arabinose transferase-like glycosyltransferase n=1 Tax=Motilibacter rhizosphaerae TaxID=598652 RepID=A0A4Q7NSF6_9ACTN|nr:glycosyltransferase family 39 protein [Motilibacter rhizosphaerae]RZS89955.1 4-amino-4-deoxy-L-arabinose transferase-like glycosyltransferase [Motilibacter rhizosphaerae]